MRRWKEKNSLLTSFIQYRTLHLVRYHSLTFGKILAGFIRLVSTMWVGLQLKRFLSWIFLVSQLILITRGIEYWTVCLSKHNRTIPSISIFARYIMTIYYYILRHYKIILNNKKKNNSRKRPLPGSNHRHNDVQNKSNNTTTFFHPSMLAHQAAMMRTTNVKGINTLKSHSKKVTLNKHSIKTKYEKAQVQEKTLIRSMRGHYQLVRKVTAYIFLLCLII